MSHHNRIQCQPVDDAVDAGLEANSVHGEARLEPRLFVPLGAVGNQVARLDAPGPRFDLQRKPERCIRLNLGRRIVSGSDFRSK